MSQTKRGRGRPKVLPTQASVRISLERADLETAEQLVPAFDRTSALGVRHTRMDVLRAAVARGLASLRADVATSQSELPLNPHR